MDDLSTILASYGLNASEYNIKPFGSGLLNHSYKITAPTRNFILQEVNTAIFKNPQAIAGNLDLINNYLKQTAPEYLFAAPLKTADGSNLVRSGDKFYRLSPFISGSHTFDFLTEPQQAYEASMQFGKFTALLNNFDTSRLQYTLPDFHNLNLRRAQYNMALQNADAERRTKAKQEIVAIEKFKYIGNTYDDIIQDGALPLRVIHHDTKINNVLFDGNGKGMCVIDLDTVMPGYYISDIGDMMRTYLSEANEEEQDLSKINIRADFFESIYKGYLTEMGVVLTAAEKDLFIYSGKFMIYMQALRFLTDFLNGDVYYKTLYPGHNLMRTKNQLRLLGLYADKEDYFKQIIRRFLF